MVVTPSGGHMEYFTNKNAKRWNVKITVDYL